jgi:hypothetical protein
MVVLDRPAGRSSAVATRKWSHTHWFAAAGVLLLFVQAYVWIDWLRTGPVQIDSLRDTSHYSFKLAVFYEVAAWCLFAVMATVLVRQCRRAGTMTFDAKLAIAAGLTYWLDPLANYVLPVYTYSEQWINLNEWVGSYPGVQNPDGGRVPEPMLFLVPVYFTGWLLFAMVVNAIMRFVRLRRPTWREGAVLAFALATALWLDILLELPMFLCDLWSNQGAPRIGFFADSGRLYPITEMAIAIAIFGTLGAMRHYRNDRGEAWMERGLSRHTKKTQAWISTLALVGMLNLMWIAGAVVWTAGGYLSGPWKEMKPWVNVGVCDTPGVSGTRYGPCPGSAGFSPPGPGDLPGSRPGGSEQYLNGPTGCETCDPVTFDYYTTHPRH